MITALIFDFDGLILETEEPVYQSWKEIYQDYDKEISLEKWLTIIGMTEEAFNPLEELEYQVGTSLPREQLIQKQHAREMELVLSRPVLPGVKEYLEDAKQMGLKTGLASSSKCDWVTGHLERLGLIHYFDTIKAADDVQKTKPDPELFNLVVEELGVPAEQVIVFEDSVNGIISAKKAGLFCIWIPNMLTSQLSTDLADMRLDSLNDISLSDLLASVKSQKTNILSRSFME